MSKVLKNHHLTVNITKSGNVSLSWDWDALLREVQIATGDRKVQYVDIDNSSPEDAKTLVKETEKKVTKARKKK